MGMETTFTENPAEFFGKDNFAAHQLPRDEVETQQIQALNARFQSLKGHISPLGVLADAQKITTLEKLEDVLLLLFPHTIYKSYPETLLLEGRYDKMTEWLSHLTSVDLSAFKENNYPTMDDWMDQMDDQTDLSIVHSSGTTGNMSFFPRGKVEMEALHSISSMGLNDKMEKAYRLGDRPNTFIWTAHAGGRAAILRGVPIIIDILTENESAFFPLIPAIMSADHQHYVMRCRNLLEQGIKAAPEPSEYVRMRVEEAFHIHEDILMLYDQLLDVIAAAKYKSHVCLIGAPAIVHKLVSRGLEKGMENMLRPESYVLTAGGFKNNPDVPTLVDDVNRFTGPNMISRDLYGMTELLSSFRSCTKGHFHVPPWVVAFVLDPKTGKARPRKGRQQGRAAFFDFLISTYWGGVVTGDLIDVDYGVCGCGRNTPFIRPGITRLSDDSHPLPGEMDQKAWTAALNVMTEKVT